ncbi:hypothetical protein [Staphylococcus intermedius]|uniref:Uncharacterized protein n=2 Tax=Staphylococcus intermedius TaxID=1285 RepID=A0A380G461_STAIN|nr:hypothetical protein [Staphylococcus intermedius]PCF63862.1 hypothetical protein B5C04_07730 [Staphylococcus intermedius]PCF78577.1 hypothetical protein B4W74_08080 [Staphylococcus intermedius]PCF79550.1 hypothetical protein B4W70_07720 [Staphylococcus intermedius]PCF86715.1 hypothetical protein B4W76_06585 [Staphylococcus intermedius]PCF89792.1 hypothetical protein B4W75_02825 [Staphylococcus intermedius]
MLKKLMLLFFGMVISTTIAETFLIAGTWQYLLMQSLSLTFILFFIYHFVVFQLREKRQTDRHQERQVIIKEEPEDESVKKRLVRK